MILEPMLDILLMKKYVDLFTLLQDKPMRRQITVMNPRFIGIWLIAKKIGVVERFGLMVNLFVKMGFSLWMNSPNLIQNTLGKLIIVTN